jgi:UDP-glucuronate decarboxylase
LIDGLVTLFESEENVTGPINLGNSQEFTILELATLVNKLTGNEAGIRFSPLPSDDPKQRKPDITNANKLLNWKPSVGLESGLRLTLSEFQNRLED